MSTWALGLGRDDQAIQGLARTQGRHPKRRKNDDTSQKFGGKVSVARKLWWSLQLWTRNVINRACKNVVGAFVDDDDVEEGCRTSLLKLT